MVKKIICRTIDGSTQEVDAEDLAWRPSVYGVAVRDGKVLLVPQWDGYDFPGGGVNLGETIDEAFRREVWEETGLDAERGEVLLCESNFFIHPSGKKPYHTMLVYYLCKSVSGEITDANFDALERQYAKKAEWVELDKIRGIKFYNPIDSVALIEKAVKSKIDVIIIHKKVWPEYFEEILSGKKKFELRLADFEVHEGDILVLEEWDNVEKKYTGRKIKVVPTYILKTKGQTFWPPEEVATYGFQIIQFDIKNNDAKQDNAAGKQTG